MARLLHQQAGQAAPGLNEVHAMIKICEALRGHFRELIRTNVISWDVGHQEQGH